MTIFKWQDSTNPPVRTGTMSSVRWQAIGVNKVCGLGCHTPGYLPSGFLRFIDPIQAATEVLVQYFLPIPMSFFFLSTVDLRCCVSFRCTAQWIYIYSFSDSFPLEVITKYWGQFPVLCSRSLLVIYFIYSSVAKPHVLKTTYFVNKNFLLTFKNANQRTLWYRFR